MRSLWNSNKHAAVQDLARHVTSPTHLQNGICLGDRRHNINKPRKNCETKSHEAAVMYLYTNGTSTPTIYPTSDASKTTPLMTMQHPRHHDGSTSICVASNYAIDPSSADNMDYCLYCRLCLARLRHASICLPLRDATRSRIINQKHVNLANLPPRARTTQVNKAQDAVENAHLNHSVPETET